MSERARSELRRAILLDRDGVLLREGDFVLAASDIALLPAARRALGEARALGFAVVVVTNQAAVARGLLSEAQLQAIHDELQHMLREAEGKSLIDRIYYCPHHPDADVPAYRQACPWRKPSPGMLEQAAKDLGIDLTQSWMVGDRSSDILAGLRAGCRTALVRSGAHEAPPIVGMDADDVEPTFVAKDVLEAVRMIAQWDTIERGYAK